MITQKEMLLHKIAAKYIVSEDIDIELNGSPAEMKCFVDLLEVSKKLKSQLDNNTSLKVINKTPTVGICNNQLGGNYLDDGNTYFSDWTCCINTHNTDYLYQSFDNEVFQCNKNETLVNGQCVKYCESDETYIVSTGTCEKKNTCENIHFGFTFF